MKKILTALLFTGLLTTGVASAQNGTAVARAIGAMSGTQADFVQKFTPRGFKNAQVESGAVVFGPSPQMRWTYAKPEKKTFVFNGTTSWFYVPSDRQVTVNQLTEKDRAELPFLLLADSRSLAANYNVKESRKGDTVTTSLTSKSSGSMIRQISVTTSARDHMVRSLEYADRQGNRTVFQFSGFRKVASDPAQFTFVAPAGVQVVRN